MNFNKICTLFTLIFLFKLLSSCTNANLPADLPKVYNAEYTPYDIQGERGYEIYFELDPSEYEPVWVTYNKVKSPILIENKVDNLYQVNIIAQSLILNEHRPFASKEVNGITFKKGNNIYHLPVNFKKK